ncbi:unnamed protein product [Protopolystoma xenopodis]|uniref:Uncharacterized protein n=1 Tax=Protopolystoma xenopodis TaxID=117903 RepID=A0A448XLC6_9PLAT|nr:unnamed protein product [Protopolystoma xenopodis]
MVKWSNSSAFQLTFSLDTSPLPADRPADRRSSPAAVWTRTFVQPRPSYPKLAKEKAQRPEGRRLRMCRTLAS